MRAAKVALVLAALYGLALAGLFAAMRLPPSQFTRFMARVPGVVARVLPFRPLWLRARAGTLQPGDSAPDFELETIDRGSRIRLSSFHGRQAVVLIFGSYT